MERLRTAFEDPRAIALGLIAILAAVVLVWAVARGGASEQERAQEMLQEGLQAHAQGDLVAAQQAYLRVLELDPRNRFAYYNLGVIRQVQGDGADAESQYRTAIQIDPDFVDALFNLAILRATGGDEEEAIELYQHIVEVDPAHAAAHLNLGFLLIESGDDELGRAELDEAVRLDPALEDRIDPELLEEPSVAGGTG